MKTVKEARKELRKKLLSIARAKGEGRETCPCCKHEHVVRKFTINRRTSKVLVIAAMVYGTKRTFNYAKVESKYILGPKAMHRTGGDFVKLCHFGLVEKVKRGTYRVTKKGVRWIRGEIEVPERVIVIGERPISIEGKPVTVIDLLGRHFAAKV